MLKENTVIAQAGLTISQPIPSPTLCFSASDGKSRQTVAREESDRQNFNSDDATMK